jgi:ubiquinone/menaquinone biosynthesis C-methylase UbiE
MPAHYDSYDYLAYWKDRDYEHGSEILAIKSFLEKIPKITTILEIGAGYGRLTPSYAFRAKKIILTDPSAKLLKSAKENLKEYKNIKFIHSGIDNLPGKVKKKSVDLVILVRVLHHLENLEKTFDVVNKSLKDRGFFILEFANKCHFKARLLAFLRGNLTFPFEIFPKDLRSKKTLKKGCLPFLNYHPDIIKEKLKNAGFRIVESRSVSNIRNPLAKKFLSTNFLLSVEKCLQKPLAHVDFGPSIFILAQKKPL